MVTATLAPTTRLVRPYSKAIQRGSLGSDIDGRSTAGKLLRRIEAELTQQLGNDLTFSQKLAVRRIARLSLQAESFDAKLASGDWTPHDSRTASGISNALMRALKDLGLKAKAPPRGPTLAELLGAAPMITRTRRCRVIRRSGPKAPAAPVEHRHKQERVPQGEDTFPWRVGEVVVGSGKQGRIGVMERLQMLYAPSMPDGEAE
jgi:hypothetical protein